MAGDVRNPPSIRVRREELIRPAERRRDFPTRVAQRHLLAKERPTWHLIAYGVILAVALVIFSVAYTTYAFSKYRGEILPGVFVDGMPLGGLTVSQATIRIENQQAAIGTAPVKLVLGPYQWSPTADQIGLAYLQKGTAQTAELVGRHESFFVQLIDRLPLHPSHSVPLLYTLNEAKLRQYIVRNIAQNPKIAVRPQNAALTVANGQVQLVPSVTGRQIDVNATMAEVKSGLDSLTKQTKAVKVNKIRPAIPDAYALNIRRQVEAFLSRPPVIQIGRRMIVHATSASLLPAISFHDAVDKRRATIVMDVNPDVLRGYVATLAQQFDQAPQSPRFHYFDGRVKVTAPLKRGRSLDQAQALPKLLRVVTGLHAGARIRFPVLTTQPPVETTNPASLGINTLLGTGVTGFAGAGSYRLQEIQAISSRLNNVLITPGEGVSYNALVGTDWPAKDYLDGEMEKGGQLVPGPGGAADQVATTFLRALYASGLKLVSRHEHPYRLQWYEPQIGLDAIVSPNGFDVLFRNNTGKYLLLQTRVEPIRQELYIYVYGPRLNWQVKLDGGTVVKTTPAPPPLYIHDPSLGPTESRQVAFAHDGADTVIHRTIVYPNGAVKVEQLVSHYQPWRAEIRTGGAVPTTPSAKQTATPGPHTPTPGPSPTPTFNH